MSTETETHPSSDPAGEHHAGEHAHPGPGQYIKVAVFLAIVTAIEVGAYYVSGIPDAILSISLLAMMVVKFFFVGMWFMHLRFDSPIFRRLFLVGIVLALLIYAVVLVSFGLLVPDDVVQGGFGDTPDAPLTTTAP